LIVDARITAVRAGIPTDVDQIARISRRAGTSSAVQPSSPPRSRHRTKLDRPAPSTFREQGLGQERG